MAKKLIALLLVFLVSSAVATPEGDVDISPQEIQQVIRNINIAVDNYYLSPEKRSAISLQLFDKLNSNQFKKQLNGEEFRKEIRATLVKATQDTGIDVTEDMSLLPNKNKQQDVKLTVELSEQKIGYLGFHGDFNDAYADQILSSSVGALTNADGLIIDLRTAENTNLSFIQSLLGVFCDEDTNIGSIKTALSATPLNPKPLKSATKLPLEVPVVILHSAFVSGEWEFFSQVMKNLNDAIIVGEHTMGIGYLTKSIKVGNDIILHLPHSTLTASGQDTSWDQFGITPDREETVTNTMKVAYDILSKRLDND